MANYMDFYNEKIQLHKEVIEDVCETYKGGKMLVWGLGHDTPLWWNITNKNAYFIEAKDEYIELNKDIPETNIVKYTYPNINVRISLKYPFVFAGAPLPRCIEKLGKFDVIIIDGPYGNSPQGPGRLLPIVWSLKYLSDPNTIIYIDDSNRELESLCIDKFCKKENILKTFHHRKGTIKYKV